MNMHARYDSTEAFNDTSIFTMNYVCTYIYSKKYICNAHLIIRRCSVAHIASYRIII